MTSSNFSAIQAVQVPNPRAPKHAEQQQGRVDPRGLGTCSCRTQQVTVLESHGTGTVDSTVDSLCGGKSAGWYSLELHQAPLLVVSIVR